MWHIEPDGGVAAASVPLVTRTYNSSPYYLGAGDSYSFGARWRHRFAAVLKAEAVSANPYAQVVCYQRADTGYQWCTTVNSGPPPTLAVVPAAVSIVRGDGTRNFFTKAGTAWVGEADVNDRLSATYSADNSVVTEWIYTAHDESSERYDTNGKLIAMVSREGKQQSFVYSTGGSNTSSCSHVQAGPVLPAGRLLCVADDFNRQLQFEYDAQGRVVTTIDPAGQSTSYSYDGPSAGCATPDSSNPACGANNLTKVTYPDGRSRTYYYNEASQINAGSVCSGTTAVGNGFGHLLNTMTSLEDENGVRNIRWTYNCAGDALSSELAGGVEKFVLAYGAPDANGISTTAITQYLGSAASPIPSVRQMNFQAVQGVAKNTSNSQPGGSGCGPASSAQTYDANGNVATRTDFNSNLTTYTYDLTRNLETKRVEASGKPEAKTLSTQWHSVWRMPVMMAEPLKITSYIYNGDTYNSQTVTCAPAGATVPAGSAMRPIGVLCQKIEQATTDTNGSQGFAASTSGTTGTLRSTNYTYDQYGQILTADGPRTDVADITSYNYYPANDANPGKRGNLATITNALGHTTQITAYDANGRALTITDSNGILTTLSYDPRGRLTSKNVGGETTNYQYDGVGLLTRLTMPDNAYINYTYDGAHRLTQINDGLGNTISYTLDLMGNRTKEDIKDPSAQLARTRSRAFDALNRLYQDIGAQNQITQYAYDANGNLTSVTDPLGQITSNTYDALNRLIKITNPANGQTLLGYNGQDRLIQVSDPRSLVTSYTLDGLGNLTTQTSPDTGSIQQSFDAAGNRVSKTDAKAQITSSQYDALNRPTLINYQDGHQEQFIWDIGGNSIGRLTRIDELDAGSINASVQYGYDTQGRVTSETRSLNGVTYTTSYRYSNARLTGMTYPSGKQVDYSLDAQGRITQITLTDNGTVTTLASAIQYSPFGGIQSWTSGAGQTVNRTQDTDGRISTYTLGNQLWQIGYDSAGRITNQTNSSDTSATATYGYDNLDRLIQSALPNTQYGYGYDANSNRTSQNTGGSATTLQISPTSNRLISISSVPPKTISFDANGSTTNDGQNQFAYDARGRMIQAQRAATTTNYRVDALGQRVRKTNSVEDTVYHYDRSGHLIAESSATGQTQLEYVWIDDLPVAVLQ